MSPDEDTYIDKNGYKRKYSSLEHRQKAYKEIYKKNRDKYPLRFKDYQIHHIDGDKQNNDIDNLKIVTKEEHEEEHGLNTPTISAPIIRYPRTPSYPSAPTYKDDRDGIKLIVAGIVFLVVLFLLYRYVWNPIDQDLPQNNPIIDNEVKQTSYVEDTSHWYDVLYLGMSAREVFGLQRRPTIYPGNFSFISIAPYGDTKGVVLYFDDSFFNTNDGSTWVSSEEAKLIKIEYLSDGAVIETLE